MSAKTIIGANRRPNVTPGGFTGSPSYQPSRAAGRRITGADIHRAAVAALERRGMQHDPSSWVDGIFGGRADK